MTLAPFTAEVEAVEPAIQMDRLALFACGAIAVLGTLTPVAAPSLPKLAKLIMLGSGLASSAAFTVLANQQDQKEKIYSALQETQLNHLRSKVARVRATDKVVGEISTQQEVYNAILESVPSHQVNHYLEQYQLSGLHPRQSQPRQVIQPEAVAVPSMASAPVVELAEGDYWEEDEEEEYISVETEPPSPGIADQVMPALKAFGVRGTHLDTQVGPSFLRVQIQPDRGVTVRKFQSLAKDLQVSLGLANPPLITPQAGYVAIDIPRADRQTAHFADFVGFTPKPDNAPVTLAVGVNLAGDLIEVNLSDPNYCHFLVGGITGSGKSEQIRGMIGSAIVRHSPDAVKLAIIDPKRVTFPELVGSPHLLQPICFDAAESLTLFEELVDEMEERYKAFQRAGVSDLATFNTMIPSPLPRILCFADEFADLMVDKTYKEDLEQAIKRLGAKARAAGIHLILGTQRPDATVITPLIRSNLPCQIGLKVRSIADSKIILGVEGAESLLGKGDMLFAAGGTMDRLQGLFIQPETLRMGRPAQKPRSPKPTPIEVPRTSKDPLANLASWAKSLDRQPTPEELREGMQQLTGKEFSPEFLAGAMAMM